MALYIYRDKIRKIVRNQPVMGLGLIENKNALCSVRILPVL